MSELVDFLLARIGEDEAVARTATVGPWHWQPDYGPEGNTGLVLTNGSDDEIVGAYNWHCCDFRIDPDVDEADQAHIARYDPARVLAECEAKRAIVELHGKWLGGALTWREGVQEGVQAALRLLAVVYSDHPDYDPLWRP